MGFACSGAIAAQLIKPKYKVVAICGGSAMEFGRTAFKTFTNPDFAKLGWWDLWRLVIYSQKY